MPASTARVTRGIFNPAEVVVDELEADRARRQRGTALDHP
jgi:hypothetical protein